MHENRQYSEREKIEMLSKKAETIAEIEHQVVCTLKYCQKTTKRFLVTNYHKLHFRFELSELEDLFYYFRPYKLFEEESKTQQNANTKSKLAFIITL